MPRHLVTAPRLAALLGLCTAAACAAAPLPEENGHAFGKAERSDDVPGSADSHPVPLVELPDSLADYRVAFDGTFLRVEYFGDPWSTAPTATALFFREAEDNAAVSDSGPTIVGLWTGETPNQTVAFTTRWRMTATRDIDRSQLPANIPALTVEPDGTPSLDDAATPGDVDYVITHATDPTLTLFPKPTDIRNIHLADWGTSGGGDLSGEVVDRATDLASEAADIAEDALATAQAGGFCTEVSVWSKIGIGALGGCATALTMWAAPLLWGGMFIGGLGFALAGCVVGGAAGAAFAGVGHWLQCDRSLQWMYDVQTEGKQWLGY